MSDQHIEERRRQMHSACPHDVISQPREFVKWCFINNWGPINELTEYTRRYKLLYDLRWVMNGNREPGNQMSHAEYAAWEYLLNVKLLEEHVPKS